MLKGSVAKESFEKLCGYVVDIKQKFWTLADYCGFGETLI